MPLITAIYAALATVLVVILGLRVVALRWSGKIALGDGGNADLAQRMRVHANAIENLPLALLLLLLLELRGIPAPWLHGLGVSLLVARVLHAWGFSRRKGTSFGRFSGTLGTWGVMLLMAAMLLVHAWH